MREQIIGLPVGEVNRMNLKERRTMRLFRQSYVIFLIAITITITITSATEPRERKHIFKLPKENNESNVNHHLLVVDKTRLIADFLNHPDKIVFVIRPSGWGKTMNLNMIRFFLEIEVDEEEGSILPSMYRVNPTLFLGGPITAATDVSDDEESNDSDDNDNDNNRNDTVRLSRTKIADDNKTMEHMGKYPVIQTSFRHVIGRNYVEIVNKTRELLKNLFGQYGYLTKVARINERDKSTFDAYRTGKTDETALGVGLRFLSYLLRTHYNRQVYVLIDDYDEPLLSIFFNQFFQPDRINNNNNNNNNNKTPSMNERVRKITESRDYVNTLHLIQRFLFDGIRKSSDVRKSLITGTFVLPFDERFESYERCHFYTMNDREFFDYYGFAATDVAELLTEAEATVNRDVFRKWFAYRLHGDRLIYVPTMIRRYLETAKLDDGYQAENEQILDRLTATVLTEKNERTINVLKDLIADVPIGEMTITKTTNFTDVSSVDRLLFNYLSFNGYVITDPPLYGKPVTITVANEKMRTALDTKLARILDVY